MKSMVIILGLLLSVSVVMLGCESREEVAPPPPVPTTPDEMPPDMPATEPATAPTAQAGAELTAKNVSNAYCAVMSDHKIDPKVTIAHAGKTVGFCCEDCIPTFKKEPEKYLATMK